MSLAVFENKSMDFEYLQYPSLEIQEPDGKEYTVRFKDVIEQDRGKNRVTIGRLNDKKVNDIVIDDPYKKVSRQHCVD